LDVCKGIGMPMKLNMTLTLSLLDMRLYDIIL
jgi:hypothetical protein